MFHNLRELAMESEWKAVLGFTVVFFVFFGLTYARRKVKERKLRKLRVKILKIIQQLGDE